MDFHDGVLRLETALIGDLVQQGCERFGFHLIGAAAGRAEQVLTFVRVLGMIARYVRLRRFQSVHQADTYQEIEMPINGQWCNFPLLPLLEQRDQLIGGNGPIGVQQLCVRG